MGYLDKHRNRVGHLGENDGDSIANNTHAFIERTFEESPTYRLAKVSSYEKPDIQETDIRVINIERLGSIKEVLFRPSFEGLGIGSYLEFDEDKWLIFDRHTSNKVLVQRCNETIKWKDKNGNIIEIPCVASASDLGSKAKQGRNELEWNKYDVVLPLGQLFIFVELTDKTGEIGINDRFIFGSKVYEVMGYDDVTAVESTVSSESQESKRYGLLQINIKITTKRDTDDFVNKIADNNSPTSITIEDNNSNNNDITVLNNDDDDIDENTSGSGWKW